MSETLAQLGEKEILNRLSLFMPKGQIDDDTAEIESNGKNLVINTDIFVEQIHFSDKTTSPFDIGCRATAANISDLICSGADQVIGITVGLIAPPKTCWNWVKNVYKGIDKSLEEYGGKLLGGDCSSGKEKIIAITAFGQLGPLRLHRSQALPGDWIVVSGPHGLSRLGLAILLSDPLVNDSFCSKQLKETAIKCHQRPTPPIEALKNLQKSKPNTIPWRAAGTDSSDGLLEAVNSLCQSSCCQAILDIKKLPKAPDWPTGIIWDEWCINGGEDFEMVLSLSPEWAKEFLKIHPNSKAIGIMKEGEAIALWSNGEKINPNYKGFKHY